MYWMTISAHAEKGKTMKKLIDADALLLALCDDPHINGANFARAKRHIEDALAVDAVEVVRCKDCKYRVVDMDFVCGHFCTRRPSAGGYFCEDNDFCSYGERREGE